MSKTRRNAGQDKVAAMRAEAARKDKQRTQIMLAVTGLLLVLIVVGVAIAVSQRGGGESSTATGSATPGTGFLATMTSVPAPIFDQVGPPTAAEQGPIQRLKDGPALTKDGKPHVVYVGGEFCPYCAGERWALVAALSRFGTVTGLAPSTTPANEGSIPTVSFKDMKFTSDVLAFDGYETRDAKGAALQALPGDITKLMDTYDAPPYVSEQSKGAIPWTWFGPWQTIGSSVPLAGFTGGGNTATVTHEQVAAAMVAGSPGLGASIDQAANLISAQICFLTKGAPTEVCNTAGVTAAAAVLPK